MYHPSLAPKPPNTNIPWRLAVVVAAVDAARIREDNDPLILHGCGVSLVGHIKAATTTGVPAAAIATGAGKLAAGVRAEAAGII